MLKFKLKSKVLTRKNKLNKRKTLRNNKNKNKKRKTLKYKMNLKKQRGGGSWGKTVNLRELFSNTFKQIGGSSWKFN